MPIELPPISRRGFIGTTAAAGLGLIAGCAADAPATDNTLPTGFDDDPFGISHPPGTHILLLSDTHINADSSVTNKAGTVNMHDHLWRVVGEAVWSWNMKPAPRMYTSPFDLILVNGDNAHLDGQPGDYAQLLRCMNDLRRTGRPIHFTLGNHDDRHAFRAALDAPASELPLHHVRRLGVDDGSRFADWFLLDSLDRVNEVPGRLGQDQLDWLDAELAVGGKPALIVLHHPPTPDDPGRKPFSLQDHAPFWAVVGRHPRVAAVFHGHTHQWKLADYAVAGRRVPLIGLPPTSYVFNPGDPWGYVVADLDDAGLTLTLHAMDDHPADRQKARIPFS